MKRINLLLAEIIFLAGPALFVLLVSVGLGHRTKDLFDATHRHNGEIFAIALTLWALLVLRYLRAQPSPEPLDDEATDRGTTPRAAILFHNAFGLAATALFFLLYIRQGYLETSFTRQWLPGIALVSLVYVIFWTLVYDFKDAGRARNLRRRTN